MPRALLSLAILTLALVVASCKGNDRRGYDAVNAGQISKQMKAPERKAKVTPRENIHSQRVDYQHGAIALEGFMAYDRSIPGKRPAVLVVHDWMGIGAHTRDVVVALARMGYFAFAADIYGKGVRPSNAEEAAAQSGRYKNDPATLRRRVNAALAFLKAQAGVNSSKIAATGYCFGGTSVLELARSGADVKGVVSFHGGLGTKAPALPGAIQSKVLVLHGANDPLVSEEEMKGFVVEMKRSGADWQMTHYSGAVHAFTNPRANKKGVAEYNARADRRSWMAMAIFLKELFER